LPSVKLLYLAGLNNVLQTARDFGFTTLNDPARYGLSLVLGGGEVNLLELTSAYGVFAREGMKIPPVSILKIEDNNGNIIEQNQKQATKVLDTQIARQINDILSDNKARSPIFGENSMLYFPGYDVAAKTGTTESYKDAWTMGYTPFAVVGVWVGNSDNSPIDKKTGIGLAAPIWRKIMEKLLISNPIENFTDPDPILETKPALSGKLDSSDTHTILYYINKDDILGPQPQDPQKDQQYFNWQSGIDNWLRSHSQY
jgi:membrane peptidoglycan carboxypeptidase